MMKRGRIVAALAIVASCSDGTEPPVPTRLAFDVQPTSTAAGVAMTPQVRVRVLDASGNAFMGAVTVMLSLGNANGATLRGPASAVSAAGVATFPDLSIVKAGTGYVLDASASGLTGATSNPFDVTAGEARRLRFVDRPGQLAAGSAFSPAVTVEVVDAHDNRVTTATTPITMWLIGATAHGIAVTGTTTVSAVAGLATFDRVTVNAPGTYSLRAVSDGLEYANSESFLVQRTALARFCPPAVAAGAAFESLGAAVTAAESGGTVIVCDGSHTVGSLNSAIVTRPLTMRAEHPGAATIFAPDWPPITVRGAPGSYTFRDLRFVVENLWALEFGKGTTEPTAAGYDQVLIENNEFTVTGARGYGVGVGATDVPTAKVTIRNNVFTGGARGVVAQSTPALEIVDNTFTGQRLSPEYFPLSGSIEIWPGGSVDIRGNAIADCAAFCITAKGVTATITDNTLSTSTGRGTRVGLELRESAGTVTGNRLHGELSVAERTDPFGYSFYLAGIVIESPTWRGVGDALVQLLGEHERTGPAGVRVPDPAVQLRADREQAGGRV